MSSNVVQFNFQNHHVRIFDQNGEPWWALGDVCDAIGILNNRHATERLSEDGVVKSDIIDRLGRKQEVSFINEANLYRLIFRSNKSEAVAFQNWVFEEVLPTIRKTGRYSEQETPSGQIDRDSVAREFVSLHPHWDVIRAMTLCNLTLDQIAVVVPMSRSAIGRARVRMRNLGLLDEAPLYRERELRTILSRRSNEAAPSRIKTFQQAS